MEALDFGFCFCRVAHHYAMSYREVMDLPIRAFWLMNSQINRLLAEKDMRSLTVAAAAQSAASAKETRDHLVAELGMVAVERPIRDEEGVNELKALARRMQA